MQCKKCKGTNVTVSANAVAKTKRRSVLIDLIMTFITAGGWLIWVLIRRRKEKIITVKTALCNSCGHSWTM